MTLNSVDINKIKVPLPRAMATLADVDDPAGTLAFESIDYEHVWWRYSRNVFACIIRYLLFNYYHWVDTSHDGLLVPEGIIHPVVSVSAMEWFTRYTYYWNVQFLNNEIINIIMFSFFRHWWPYSNLAIVMYMYYIWCIILFMSMCLLLTNIEIILHYQWK